MPTHHFRGRRRAQRRQSYVGVNVRRFASNATQQQLLDAVSRATGVPPIAILGSTRGPADAAFARQLVMYLLHTGLGRSYDDTAALVGRNRKTVSHACAVVEDLRDEPDFDADLTAIEELLTAQAHTGTEDGANA
jgi:chromosomal replication initiation ATPase DnaA